MSTLLREAARRRTASKVRSGRRERAWLVSPSRGHRPEEGAGLGWERFDYGSHLGTDCVFDAREVVTSAHARDY